MLHLEQRAYFESNIITELCGIMELQKGHIKSYHPQGDAGPERMKRILLSMLLDLRKLNKLDWK